LNRQKKKKKKKKKKRKKKREKKKKKKKLPVWGRKKARKARLTGGDEITR